MLTFYAMSAAMIIALLLNVDWHPWLFNFSSKQFVSTQGTFNSHLIFLLVLDLRSVLHLKFANGPIQKYFIADYITYPSTSGTCTSISGMFSITTFKATMADLVPSIKQDLRIPSTKLTILVILILYSCTNSFRLYFYIYI